MAGSPLRRLVLVLGDQLDPRASALDGFDAERDAVWMAEVEEEARHVACHKLRIAVFFAAMRHFRDELRERGFPVHYTELPRRPQHDRGSGLAEVLAQDLRELGPASLVVTRPGDHCVLEALRETARDLGLTLEVREDRHFYSSPEHFAAWARDRKQLVQESFYRALRSEQGILVDGDGKPEGGRWNLDVENRQAFGRDGPGEIPAPKRFTPDAICEDVIALVEERFPEHPGSLEHFELPVTRRDARSLLRDFVRRRLPAFGRYEDAMWTGEPFLYHSRLSLALNLKLLDPRECVEAAIAAYEAGQAPLNSVEGFVRQIVGWREFVRGIYWHFMPDYIEENALDCEDRDVPHFYWHGRTRMRCVAEAMQQVLDHGYTHHIVRLMVLGLFAQLLGVHPRRFHEWHMALYLDAVDWVSLPNTLGMSQHGDGGLMATKPYCASGAYVHRMSNFCGDCDYDPKRAEGEDACPFTSLYWDFLARHRRRFAGNRRMALQLRNLARKSSSDLRSIRRRAGALRRRIDAEEEV